MRHPFPRWILLLLAGLIPLSGHSDPGGTYYLVRNRLLCDSEEIACLRGTLTYNEGTRTFAVRGRIQKSERPGVLQIILQASERDERIPTVYVDIPVTGRSTQIVDVEVISDQPADITDWQILCVLFLAPGDDSPRVLSPRPD